MHFFNPVPVLPLVEVVASEISRRDYVDRAMFVSGAMKKQPIRCKSSPGFLVNRALLPYLFGAIEAVNDGANPDMLDQALVAFGMPMGPIELCDQVGLDVCLNAGEVIGISEDAARRPQDRLSILGSLAASQVPASMNGTARRPSAPVVTTIGRTGRHCFRVAAPLVGECRSAVAEGVVENADMADAACIFGIGFPAFRGGPLFWDESRV